MCDSGAIGPTFDQAKNHNKRFGEFEFEYFGDSDVVNKLEFEIQTQNQWKNKTLLTCSLHRNLQNIRIQILQIFVLIFFNESVANNLRQILD